MTRAPEQVVAAMAAAARLAAFDADSTWYDVLFEPGPDGLDTVSLPDQPDRALLAALATEYAELDAHVALLPDRTRLAWLRDIMGIPRLPVVPDRVVAHVTADPKLAPAIVPRGTTLRGGKDAFGNERRYLTLDALTAHGAALVAVRVLTPGGNATGLPGIATEAPEFPLTPMAGPNAVHTMRVYSPALAFDGGDLTAQLAFGGAAGVAALAGASWRYSRADGTPSPTTTGIVSGSNVTVTLTGSCGAPDGATPWLECVIPAHVPVPESFGFSSVTVRVSARTEYVPQAAFYNDGLVDITKEFQPFGAAAKRGDAFYLRSDEAFGKTLAGVTISVAVVQEGGGVVSAATGGSGVPTATGNQVKSKVDQIKKKLEKTYGTAYEATKGDLDAIGLYVVDQGNPSVQWQRRVDGHWVNFGQAADRFGTVSGDMVPSERFTVAGQEGHFVRAFLSAGDFGWTAYQAALADFATRAVAGTTPKPTMPTPPVPPVVSGITISYITLPVAATRVESTSGWRHAVKPVTGTFHPFRRAVSETGDTGMVAIGLELPDMALGSSVSLYFEVDSASPCGAVDPVDARWQWCDGSGWQDLAVADGSRQLRESGLLRFVAPLAWPVGCADASAATGRWIRLVTNAPDRLGDVHAVVVDAVLADFVSRAVDPQLDTSSATALPPGTIKGLLSPIRGVKKVTNLASVRGRGPESDQAYLTRASARVRHRDRAIAPWDYEQRVILDFPEVAAVRCLPHTNGDGHREPGKVGLVVVPDRPLDPAPRPSVGLTERIIASFGPAKPIGAEIAVLCPLYKPAIVVATIRLRPGIAALTGKETITAALETLLHPTGTVPTRWGRTLYASTLIAFLERQPSVDVVTSFDLRDATGSSVELVEVDACRGLYCSSAAHEIACEEQL
jgi:Baseplate J-like protein